jgi:hypothetical protein
MTGMLPAGADIPTHAWQRCGGEPLLDVEVAKELLPDN